jgi:hypothetical protein
MPHASRWRKFGTEQVKINMKTKIKKKKKKIDSSKKAACAAFLCSAYRSCLADFCLANISSRLRVWSPADRTFIGIILPVDCELTACEPNDNGGKFILLPQSRTNSRHKPRRERRMNPFQRLLVISIIG